MGLPEITEVKRLALRPGDALVVRVDSAVVTRADGDFIKEYMRRNLRLPADFPVIVLTSGTDVSVVNHAPA